MGASRRSERTLPTPNPKSWTRRDTSSLPASSTYTSTCVSRVASIGSTAATGSAADVAAAGRWQEGRWTLELRRALDTGHGDDVRFYSGQEIQGQIAVFNRSGGEHKSVSEPLLFRID